MFLKYLLFALALPVFTHNATYVTGLPINDIDLHINDIDLPIVVLHGVASSASNMQVFCDWLELSFNRKVYNI